MNFDRIEPAFTWGANLVRCFFDPWIAMITLGGLGHQINKPFLYHFGYWNFVLFVIAIQSLWGTDRGIYKLKKGKNS